MQTVKPKRRQRRADRNDTLHHVYRLFFAKEHPSILLPEPIRVKLNKHNLINRIRRIPHQVTMDDVYRSRPGLVKEHHLKTLVFQVRLGSKSEPNYQYCVCVLSGNYKVNTKVIAMHFNVAKSRVSSAPTDTAEALTGYKSGSINPIALRKPLPTFYDHRLTQFKTKLHIGTGCHTLELSVTLSELLVIAPGEFKPFGIPPKEKKVAVAPGPAIKPSLAMTLFGSSKDNSNPANPSPEWRKFYEKYQKDQDLINAFEETADELARRGIPPFGRAI